MRIKLFIFLSFLTTFLCAWEGNFELSEAAQNKADFYNKFIQAFALEQANNPQEALPILKELLTQNPDDKHLIQEYCYLALNNQQEDFNFCKTALESVKEKSWQNRTLLGDYYLRDGSLTQALAEYKKALKLNPENLELTFYYTGILASKDQNAAINYLQNLAKNYPQADGYISVKIAEIYLKNREDDKAVSYLENALKTAQNKAEIYQALIRIYESKHNAQALYKTYQNMYKDGFVNAGVVEKLANMAVFQKDDENAEKYFKELLKIDETNPYAARYFAFAEQSQGNYEGALNYLKKARDFDTTPAMQIKAGYYLSMLSKQEELSKLMGAAYKKFPNNNEISYYYALALVDAKKYKEAANIFEEILKTSPEKELVLFNYGAVLYEQKKYNKMKDILHRLLELNPNNAEALNFLGYFLVDQGSKKDLQEGYNLITRALNEKPQEVAYLDSLAWYYFKAGEAEKASQILNTLKDVKDEEIYFHKAEVALALKDFETAAKNYESALKINPNNKAAKKGLKKAKKGI